MTHLRYRQGPSDRAAPTWPTPTPSSRSECRSGSQRPILHSKRSDPAQPSLLGADPAAHGRICTQKGLGLVAPTGLSEGVAELESGR